MAQTKTLNIQENPLPHSPHISSAEAHYILSGHANNLRLDGRENLHHRRYTTTSSHSQSTSGASLLPLCNGSARVSLPGGITDVLCSVRADILRPSKASPNSGVVTIAVEALHVPDRHAKRRYETELGRVLTHLLLGGNNGGGNTGGGEEDWRRGLCILEGSYAWRLSIDVTVLACDGNCLDVCSLAIKCGVSSCRLPIVTSLRNDRKDGGGVVGQKKKMGEELSIEGDARRAIPPPGSEDCPLIVTVTKVPQPPSSTTVPTSSTKQTTKTKPKKTLSVLDCTALEETCSQARVAVSVDRHGMICGVQTLPNSHGSTPAAGNTLKSVGYLMEMTHLAVDASEELFTWLDTPSDRTSGAANKQSGMGGSRGTTGELLKPHFAIR